MRGANRVLHAISPNVFHAGGVGSGDVIKLVNNTLYAANRLVGLEGMALALMDRIAKTHTVTSTKS